MAKRIALIISGILIIALAVMIVMNISRDTVRLDLYFYKTEIKEEMKNIVNAFTLDYPNIRIQTETFPNNSLIRLRTRLFSGDAPDIMQLQSYAQVFEFASAGYLLDLSGEPVISLVPEAYMSAVTFGNKAYALPMDFSGIGIVYNRKIFAKYGLSPPRTYSALKKVCEELKSRRIVPFTGMLKEPWSAGHLMTLLHTSLAGSNDTINKWITNMDAGKASWADPVDAKKLFDIMDFYRDNLDPQSDEKDEKEQIKTFVQEKAAMMVQGLWVGISLEEKSGLDWGFIPFPGSENPAESKFYADVDSAFAISATAGEREKDAARKFLAWLATGRAIALWTGQCRFIPLFKDADKSSLPAPFLAFLTHCEQHGSYDWEFNKFPLSVYEDAIKNGASGYLSGQRSKEEVIKYIDDSWGIAIR
jgi:raffinose/stachyose/melibiose transport system substrate-binding protein